MIFFLSYLYLVFIFKGLNVRKVTLSQDRELYGVEMHAEPNYPTLGKKAGGKFLFSNS
jgi:hypothetical protein